MLVRDAGCCIGDGGWLPNSQMPTRKMRCAARACAGVSVLPCAVPHVPVLVSDILFYHALCRTWLCWCLTYCSTMRCAARACAGVSHTVPPDSLANFRTSRSSKRQDLQHSAQGYLGSCSAGTQTLHRTCSVYVRACAQQCVCVCVCVCVCTNMCVQRAVRLCPFPSDQNLFATVGM